MTDLPFICFPPNEVRLTRPDLCSRESETDLTRVLEKVKLIRTQPDPGIEV